jgi:hypothetical protein
VSMKTTLIGAALLAGAIAPGLASAGFVLDTGTPGGSSSTTLSNAQWVAAEFTLSSAEDITSISTYLNGGTTGQLNTDSYTYIFYDTSVIGARASNRASDEAASPINGTFTVNGGWNTTATNVTLGPGTYYLAVQTTTSQTKGLYLPTETSAGTGTVPAQGFAWYSTTGTSSQFSANGAPTFGVQIAATPVPLPAAVWLLAGGLGMVGTRIRRRRALEGRG